MLKYLCPLVAASLALISFSRSTLSETLSFMPAVAPPPPTRTRITELTIRHEDPIAPLTNIVVGYACYDQYSRDSDVQFKSPEYLRQQADFIRRAIEGPGIFDSLAALLEVHEEERPWETLTRLHLFAFEPTPGKLVPFATLARQMDGNEAAERMGTGAGVLFQLDRNVSLTSELIYLGADRAAGGAGYQRETMFLTRLQIDF